MQYADLARLYPRCPRQMLRYMVLLGLGVLALMEELAASAACKAVSRQIAYEMQNGDPGFSGTRKSQMAQL